MSKFCNPLYVPHMLVYKHIVKKKELKFSIDGRMFCHVGRGIWHESLSDISETVTLNTFPTYRRTPLSMDSVSAVSVICGLPWAEKIWKIEEINDS